MFSRKFLYIFVVLYVKMLGRAPSFQQNRERRPSNWHMMKPGMAGSLTETVTQGGGTIVNKNIKTHGKCTKPLICLIQKKIFI